MPTRVVVLPPGDPWAALDARVSQLSKVRDTVVVNVRRPLAVAHAAFTRAGAELSRLFILQVGDSAARVSDPHHEAVVPSATNLEAVLARVRGLVRRREEGPVTVVVDDVGTFLARNTRDSCVQMARIVAHERVRRADDREFIVGPGFDMAFWRQVQHLYDDVVGLMPGGELAALFGGKPSISRAPALGWKGSAAATPA